MKLTVNPITGLLDVTGKGGGGGGNGIKTINGVSPDASGNLALEGTAPLSFEGSKVSISDATSSAKGAIVLASDAETIAGTDSAKAVTPSTLKAKLGDQTLNKFAVGAGSAAAVQWASVGSSDGSIKSAYDASTKQLNLEVTNPVPTWHFEELEEAAWFEDPNPNYVYYCNANSPVLFRIKSKSSYKHLDTFWAISLTRGWEVEFLYPEDNTTFYVGDKISTPGTGKLKSPKYGDPADKSFIKLTYFDTPNCWIADVFIPGVEVS